MSLEAIREALQSRLAALTPESGTAWRNRAFAPTPGEPWQSVDMLPLDPDDAEIGAAGHWERGIMQVTLRYPSNAGPAFPARAYFHLRRRDCSRHPGPCHGARVHGHGSVLQADQHPLARPRFDRVARLPDPFTSARLARAFSLEHRT